MGIIDYILHPQHQIDDRRAEVYKSLIHWEAQIGGQLFGEVPPNVRREFFCLDKHTWVWHEEWTDESGHHAMTTRYDVRNGQVVKSQGASNYQELNKEELRNFINAVKLYYQRVIPELHRMGGVTPA
jgi:hypothetical protein